jgi:L-alanine-DL-glutamate epimerase-like enolase superfamily enzyme
MRRRDFALASSLGFAAPAFARRGARPLRVTKVTATEVRNVPTGKGLILPWDPKRIPQDSRDYVIVQVFTDQGVIGTTMDGEYKLPAGVAAEVLARAAAYFPGKDPFDIERHNIEFFQKATAPFRLFFIEIALWDIIGKTVGLPLYRLWGAFTDKVKPYAATVHFDKTPEQRAEDAQKFLGLGFRAIKLRLHNESEQEDLRMARTVIDAVRGRMDVMVDANQAGKRKGDPPPVWDVERAIRTARALEEMGLYWLEEPLYRHDYDGLARVRASLKRMHLAGAEGNVGLADFAEILSRKALSYIQPDPVQSGTLTMVRKMAGMAESFGVLFGPHHGKSGVGMLASLHMQCSAPNSGYLEYMYDPGFWNPEGFQAGFEAPWPVDKSGYVSAPEAPGLGAPWDRAFFRKHKLTFG